LVGLDHWVQVIYIYIYIKRERQRGDIHHPG
jgi:hypothetical protein